jgi:transposase-like protein
MSNDNGRLDTNPSSDHNASRITEERKQAVRELLRSGVSIDDIAKSQRMSPNNVMAIKRSMPESTGLNDEFKASTVRNLKSFVQQASQKLVDELDNLHVSQIPIAMGIAIDKIQALQDQPQAVVEHRFTVDHASLDKLLKSRGADLRKSKEVIIDGEFEAVKPEDTAKFLNWAKDPKGSFLEIKDEPINPSALDAEGESRPPPPPNHG